MTLAIPVMRLAHGKDLPLPAYQTPGSAGMDLLAAIDADEKIVIKSLERVLVATGLVLQIPHGYEGQIRPRSGLAVKCGVTVVNAPGTIDADYRGEVKVALINLGSEAFTITRGMRIAQLVIAPVTLAWLEEVPVVDETERGSGGFGSTGTRSRTGE